MGKLERAIVLLLIPIIIVSYILQYHVIVDPDWQWYIVFVTNALLRFLTAFLVFRMAKQTLVELAAMGYLIFSTYDLFAELINLNTKHDITGIGSIVALIVGAVLTLIAFRRLILKRE